MTQDESVTATFTQDYYTLTVAIFGDGSVTSTDGYINCPGYVQPYLSFPDPRNAECDRWPGMGFWRMEWRLPWHCRPAPLRMTQSLTRRRHLFTSAAIRRRHPMPAGGHATGSRRQRPDSGRTFARLSHSAGGRLQHSHDRRSVFTKCLRSAARAAGLPHDLAHWQKTGLWSLL